MAIDSAYLKRTFGAPIAEYIFSGERTSIKIKGFPVKKENPDHDKPVNRHYRKKTFF
jgi:hypothetical protein